MKRTYNLICDISQKSMIKFHRELHRIPMETNDFNEMKLALLNSKDNYILCRGELAYLPIKF